jgi:putative ABC transport system permease protein
VLTLRTPLTDPRLARTPAIAALVHDGMQRVGGLPGVSAVGAAVSFPLASDWLTSFQIIGRPLQSAPPLASERIISPGYVEVFGMRLIRGRAFTERDRTGTSPVALVNETMARQFWPGRDPLAGQVVLFPGFVSEDDPPRQIVGVVADVRDGAPLNGDPRPTVYVTLAQVPDRLLHAEPLAWVVRTPLETTAIGAAVTKELERLSGGLAVTNVRSMDGVSAGSTAPTRFATTLMTLFGGSALLLAAIGVYGVMAYSLQRRTHEIGIRLALGAQPRHVRNLLLASGMRVTVLGVAIGLAAAFGLARVLSTFLFAVTPHDPIVFVGAPLVRIAVALLATWVPAHRATFVDPVVALRAG